jgi:ABC-type lipoprotein release transport system permease subunit
VSEGGGVAMTAVILVLIGVAACAIPLRRALRLQPTELLREN